jgi:hypothetical protein
MFLGNLQEFSWGEESWLFLGQIEKLAYKIKTMGELT